MSNSIVVVGLCNVWCWHKRLQPSTWVVTWRSCYNYDVYISL